MRNFLLPSLILAVFITGCGSTGATGAKTPVEPGSVPARTQVTEQSLGLAFYPGSRLVGGIDEGKHVSADLSTSDPPPKVVEFYETLLNSKAKSQSGMFTIDATKTGVKYAIAVLADKGVTSVTILGERP